MMFRDCQILKGEAWPPTVMTGPVCWAAEMIVSLPSEPPNECDWISNDEILGVASGFDEDAEDRFIRVVNRSWIV